MFTSLFVLFQINEHCFFAIQLSTATASPKYHQSIRRGDTHLYWEMPDFTETAPGPALIAIGYYDEKVFIDDFGGVLKSYDN